MLTMDMSGNEQSSSTNATGPATCLHPVTFHALDQAQGSVGDCILLLPGEISVLHHQLVHKAVNVQTGVDGPAAQKPCSCHFLVMVLNIASSDRRVAAATSDARCKQCVQRRTDLQAREHAVHKAHLVISALSFRRGSQAMSFSGLCFPDPKGRHDLNTSRMSE